MRIEERALPVGNAALGFGKQGAQEAVHLVGLAVVGVESHEHIVLLRKAMHRLSNHDGTDGGILHRRAGGELTAAEGNLDDTIGLSLGKRLERAVDDFERGDIHGGIGIALFLGRVEHLDVLFLGGYWHGT